MAWEPGCKYEKPTAESRVEASIASRALRIVSPTQGRPILSCWEAKMAEGEAAIQVVKGRG